MLDCQLAILENAIIKYSATGVVAGPMGAVHPTVTPFQAFETKDNYVIAACGNNRLYAAFCNALGCPELSGVIVWQFADVRVDESWFSSRPRCMNNKGLVDEYRRPKLAYAAVREVFRAR